MQQKPINRIINLLNPNNNHITSPTPQQAHKNLLTGNPQAVRQIQGSYALITQQGTTIRLARSLDRPTRYFLAKHHNGPLLIIADRIHHIHTYLKTQNLQHQFHPTYTRMIPAHHILTLQLIGCPDPQPTYTRYLNPQPNQQPPNIQQIGNNYIGALIHEITQHLQQIPPNQPIGITLSGGIDSGAIFLATHHAIQQNNHNPARLKAFTLAIGKNPPEPEQARQFLDKLGLAHHLETIQTHETALNLTQTLRTIEDYKPLDVECAAMTIALYTAIRQQYPNWKHLIDGDGGDENLKDYPIETNPQLTIQSILNNPLLYQEGWGIDKIKHSPTYTGGLSRSYTRTYAPAQQHNLTAFSPYTRPALVEIAESIPYAQLTQYDPQKLYQLKGQIIAAGIQHHTGYTMPIYPKRRFQNGAATTNTLRRHIPDNQTELRQRCHALYN